MSITNKGYICCACRKPISLKNRNCLSCGEANLYISIREIIVKTILCMNDKIRTDIENLLEETSTKHDGLGGVINRTNIQHLKWWLTNKIDVENHEELKIIIDEILETCIN